MDYDTFIEGLKERGFQYTEDVCNKGGCHIDERHFILLTDGLVIYSNFWDWNACNKPSSDYGYVEGGLCEIWSFENPEDSWLMPNTREFTFEELDRIIC
jgi:hypothetical protein